MVTHFKILVGRVGLVVRHMSEMSIADVVCRDVVTKCFVFFSDVMHKSVA